MGYSQLISCKKSKNECYTFANFDILIICFSDVILKILVHDNQIGVIIGQEGSTVRKIMSETDTNIIVPR